MKIYAVILAAACTIHLTATASSESDKQNDLRGTENEAIEALSARGSDTLGLEECWESIHKFVAANKVNQNEENVSVTWKKPLKCIRRIYQASRTVYQVGVSIFTHLRDLQIQWEICGFHKDAKLQKKCRQNVTTAFFDAAKETLSKSDILSRLSSVFRACIYRRPSDKYN